MNARCSRPLLQAACLVLALAFAPAHGLAQGLNNRFNSGPTPRIAPPGPELPAAKGSSRQGPLTMRYVMAVLINATRLAPGTGVLDKSIADAFGLGENTFVLPVAPVPVIANNGAMQYFAVPRISERDVVVIFRRLENGSVEAYLSDFSGRLRGAIVVQADGTVRKLSLFKAAGKFQAELSVLEKEVSADLQRYILYNKLSRV